MKFTDGQIATIATGMSTSLFVGVILTADYHDMASYGVAALILLIALSGVLAGVGIGRSQCSEDS
jgi:hypothetical protein